ncbi:olfactory receptor 49-like [Eublepharis macularius]|uniref:Olfactory receptor n=1 Tax=Eublepharis macularius TaxID=481883 RepID=A0AA97LBU4_EUBMA|nr:olfactory receptor 49-like [Eublepharis macularius]
MNLRNFSQPIIITEVILLGFSNIHQLQKPLFFFFLVMYILTLLCNGLVILLIEVNHRLKTPMYYFLKNLSWMEIIITTTVTPKMLSLLILEDNTMPFFACVLQGYIYFVAGSSEVFLLAAMSVDRYMAICNPLRYTSIMRTQICQLMVLSCWLWGFLSVTSSASLTMKLPFCGPNIIDHFFCDNGPVKHLICADIHFLQTIDLAVSCFNLLGSVSVTAVSYICIVVTVMRIPSAKGRKKAFSTCSSHITVASLYYGSSMFIYIKPAGESSTDLNKVATVLNTVVTPLLNPIIYTFRNKVVKEAVKDVLGRM